MFTYGHQFQLPESTGFWIPCVNYPLVKKSRYVVIAVVQHQIIVINENSETLYEL